MRGHLYCKERKEMVGKEKMFSNTRETSEGTLSIFLLRGKRGENFGAGGEVRRPTALAGKF